MQLFVFSYRDEDTKKLVDVRTWAENQEKALESFKLKAPAIDVSRIEQVNGKESKKENDLAMQNSTSVPATQGTDLPHPLDAEWLVDIDGKVYGPFTGFSLKKMSEEGRLEHDSLVKKLDGKELWVKALEDRTLSKFFSNMQSGLNKEPSVSASDRAQVVTVNNNVTPNVAYLGERPVNKSRFLAVVLSLLIVGVGQMYNGEIGKGILMLIGCILLWMVALGWIINIWSIIDAYIVSNRKKEDYERWLIANTQATAARSNVNKY